MKVGKSIWLPLLIPSIGCGVPAAIGAYVVLGSLTAALFVIGGSLAAAILTAQRIRRNSQRASAQLRRPELRSPDLIGTGVYHSLLAEAIGLLEGLQRESKDASRQKTELEAHAHVQQKQTRRLESALNCLVQPVLITDPRDQLLFCNPPAMRLFHPDALVTADSNGVVRQLDLNQVPAIRQLVEETRTRNAATDHRDCEFELHNGEETLAYRATATNVFENGQAVFENNRRLLGVVTVLADIRDEREQKTRHAEFVSSVCHELKTPMASIKAFIEMLMDGDVTETDEQMELYGFIDVQIDRLTRLVNNMLNLTRIQSGVIKINREDCELNDVLGKALSVVQPMAEEKQIRVISELSELYFPVHVDRDVFGQAVINLLSNAVKYTPGGGEVRLRSRMEENEAIIDVRDNGMGIPEESLPHIFDRFYRVPQNNKAAAGTGLGLSLVHYIVTELHNGKISVDSTVDAGTCFTVTIPLGHVDQSRKTVESRVLRVQRDSRPQPSTLNPQLSTLNSQL